MDTNNKRNILMVGPARDVRGGISTVVNSYYDTGLEQKCNLKYIETMKDGSHLKKLIIAVKAYLQFCYCVKNYDIVHIHMSAQMSYTRKSFFIRKAKRAGKKIIIHQHSADFDDFYFNQCDEKKKKEIRIIFSLADKVITLSEEWGDFFGRNVCNPVRIVIIHNAVKLPEYKKTNYRDHNVLFLGRLGKRKGIYDLLEALPEILKVVPDAKFYLGGDGDLEQSKEIVQKKGASDYVKFLGWVRGDIKEKYLRNCSVFILPSYQEGMPMSLLEAMSYGLAVISTNAGGIPQVIQSGINGLRFEAGDVDKLKECLISLLTDEKLKQKYGQKGYETIEEKFSVEKNIDKLVGIYQSMEDICNVSYKII